MELEDLTRELGGITMTRVPGYVIISPDEKQAHNIREFFFKEYGIEFDDSGIATPRRLLREQAGLAASYFKQEDFERIKDHPGWIVRTIEGAQNGLRRIHHGQPSIRANSIISVNYGGCGSGFSRDIKLAELPPEKRNQVIKLLARVLENLEASAGRSPSHSVWAASSAAAGSASRRSRTRCR